MVSYNAVEGSPELAAIRAQANALRDKALQGKVTTMGGTYAIGKGYSPGANKQWLDAYQKAVESGTSGRAMMFAVTGNVTRDMPQIQGMIAQLESNKIGKNVQDVQMPVLPKSTYEDVIGNPADLTPDKINTTHDAQVPTQIATIAPRADTVDIMAPSLIPDLNPPSFIPNNSAPNNLIDANAETTDTNLTVTGDSYTPYDDTTDTSSPEDPYGYAIASGDDQGNTMDDASQQDVGLMLGA